MNPESTLSVPIMLDVLLMVIIGGLGTLYGGIVGAGVLLTARTLLPDLRASAPSWSCKNCPFRSCCWPRG